MLDIFSIHVTIYADNTQFKLYETSSKSQTLLSNKVKTMNYEP